MADYAPVAVQSKPPQPMTLADMVNLAGGVQQYQQRAATNPLALQQQQQLTEQGGYTTDKARQENTERVALQDFMSVPDNYMTNGNIDLKKAYSALPKIAPLTHVNVLDKLTSLSNAQTGVQKAKQDLTQDQRQIIASRLSVLGRLGINHPDDYKRELEILKKENPENPELHNLTDQYAKLFNNLEPGDYISKGAIREAQSLLTPQQQETTFAPKTSLADVGPTLQPISTTPSIGGEEPRIQKFGQPIAKGLSPESRKSVTQVDPVSGDTIVYDIDASGQPTNVRYLKKSPQANIPQSVRPGQTAETAQVPAKSATKSVVDANTLMNDASQAGHIPTQLNVANTLLTKLKNPNLDTGPIQNFLAGKTAGESLTPEQQEVAKLLQQRIQNLSPRTDADAESKRQAYGSLSMKKPALIDLIRRDIGNLTNQEMLHGGTLNAAGDMTSPNLPAVNNFQQKFTQFSKDPVLMQYIGIVGKGQKARIDDQDKSALSKLFQENKLTPDQIQKMEAQRKLLVQMSGGQQ
jgi:hypothetical protein